MLVFQVLLHRLSFREKADAQKRCSGAEARLVESHPVSQVTMTHVNAPHETDDGKFQIALALQDDINSEQIALVLRDLGHALGIDLNLPREGATSSHEKRPFTARLIDI